MRVVSGGGTVVDATAPKKPCGTLRRLLSSLSSLSGARRSGAAPRSAGQDVSATVDPVRTRARLTLFRCRIWDANRDSAPFHVWADRRLLSAEPRTILAALAWGSDAALAIVQQAADSGRLICITGSWVRPAYVLEAMRQHGSGPEAFHRVDRAPARHPLA